VMEQKLDYLFVDEAGQVSLANVVATGISARNIVLVGDQMQLPQPVKGVHPGGSGVSALDHLVGDWATVPPDRGVFLARTWRMHPSLCEVVSQAFYDGELKAVEATAKQRIVLTDDDDGFGMASGLTFIGVEHDDCSQRSELEAAAIRDLYHLLLRLSWVDGDGESRLVSANDVLVVSPYNMQVNLLREMLPEGARVGTVDKFQGQEAAVVLVSMTSSNGENIPKGIGFLLSPNRLNVAISRARCLAVVVASPELLAIKCSRIEHMRLVNTLCWMRAAGQEAGSRRESYAR
jgi:superfamily I DNA and/or RNA helicase